MLIRESRANSCPPDEVKFNALPPSAANRLVSSISFQVTSLLLLIRHIALPRQIRNLLHTPPHLPLEKLPRVKSEPLILNTVPVQPLGRQAVGERILTAVVTSKETKIRGECLINFWVIARSFSGTYSSRMDMKSSHQFRNTRNVLSYLKDLLAQKSKPLRSPFSSPIDTNGFVPIHGRNPLRIWVRVQQHSRSVQIVVSRSSTVRTVRILFHAISFIPIIITPCPRYLFLC